MKRQKLYGGVRLLGDGPSMENIARLDACLMWYDAHMTTRKQGWIDIFWSRVLKTSTCWIWGGHIDKYGYGTFGHIHKWSRSYSEVHEVRAHRISWVLSNGPIPEKMWILHRCDSPPCVNPDHLFLGDNDINSFDREFKGRHGKGIWGEQCAHTPLTEKDVRRIRELWDSGLYTQFDLSNTFGVGQSSISEIVAGKTWKHLL